MRVAKNLFCLSAGVIFLITGMAKIWSAFGKAGLLKLLDPILNMQFGHIMLIVGVLELGVAGLCLLGRSKTTAIMLTACLAGSLVAYRCGLWWIGWHPACACLGSLMDAIQISPQRLNEVMKGLLAYLFVGSYGILIFQWLRGRNLKLADFEAQRRGRRLAIDARDDASPKRDSFHVTNDIES